MKTSKTKLFVSFVLLVILLAALTIPAYADGPYNTNQGLGYSFGNNGYYGVAYNGVGAGVGYNGQVYAAVDTMGGTVEVFYWGDMMHLTQSADPRLQYHER